VFVEEVCESVYELFGLYADSCRVRCLTARKIEFKASTGLFRAKKTITSSTRVTVIANLLKLVDLLRGWYFFCSIKVSSLTSCNTREDSYGHFDSATIRHQIGKDLTWDEIYVYNPLIYVALRE
jgi:hypothetical protein